MQAPGRIGGGVLAPHFHDDGMLIPDVNERGMTLTDRDEDQHRPQEPTTGPPPSDPNGWLDWAKDPSQKYEIERIVGAHSTHGTYQNTMV